MFTYNSVSMEEALVKITEINKKLNEYMNKTTTQNADLKIWYNKITTSTRSETTKK